MFCQFGPIAAVPAVLESDTSLVCVTPTGLEPGPTLLRVTNNIDIWTNASEFVFDVPVHLLTITPNRGTMVGGTKVILNGLHFPQSEQAACLFGMVVKVPALWLSPTSVACKTPPWAMMNEGVANSTLSTTGSITTATTVQYIPNGVDVVSQPTQLIYTYDVEVMLSKIWPQSGSMDGGTLVRIEGQHFRASTHVACRFGNADVKGTYISPTRMQCLSPDLKSAGSGSATTGVVVLRVTTNGKDWSVENIKFQSNKIKFNRTNINYKFIKTLTTINR